jgi:hypothetical protein
VSGEAAFWERGRIGGMKDAMSMLLNPPVPGRHAYVRNAG